MFGAMWNLVAQCSPLDGKHWHDSVNSSFRKRQRIPYNVMKRIQAISQGISTTCMRPPKQTSYDQVKSTAVGTKKY